MSGLLALFGTSADPPTVGHQAVLAGLLEHYPKVCTWASENPFKEHCSPLEVRSALLGAVVQGLAAQHQPGRLQQRQELSSRRAIDSLQAAQRLFPGDQPVFVVGTDLLAQIPSWYAVNEWLPNYQLAVVPRQGWPLDDQDLLRLERLGARIEHLPLLIPASASSAIRRHPNPELVPAELLPMLVAQKLYGFTTADLPFPCGSP